MRRFLPYFLKKRIKKQFTKKININIMLALDSSGNRRSADWRIIWSNILNVRDAI